MEGTLETLCGLTVIILFLYYYLTLTFDYWKVRGVKGPQPIPLVGNMKDMIFRKTNMTKYLLNIYDSYNDERYVGLFFGNKPVLIIRDPQLINDILITDFSSFSHRGIEMTGKVDPLMENLFFFEALKWRPLRNKFTPAFSCGKIKDMFPLIMICSDHLEQYINKIPDNNILEIRELTAQYTIDVIGSCLFGIETDPYSDEESEFCKMGKELFNNDIIFVLKQQLQFHFPKLFDKLGILFRNNRQISFFTNIVKKTMEHRIKNNIIRNDFINTLIELKANPEKLGEEIELTDTVCAAQVYLFFAAGFETSSLTMAFTLYELAQNHNIQDKVRKEINNEFEKNNGILKFESIKALKYLQAVIQETLRKHPPVIILFRECVIPSYTFKGTNVTIHKNQKIIIPTIGLHYDPNYYPNPNSYDPERFMTENKAINDGTYLPFGNGPRNCLGVKFAECQMIIGLATFLRNRKVDVCEKTKIPFTIGPSEFLLQPMDGIYLKVSKINE